MKRIAAILALVSTTYGCNEIVRDYSFHDLDGGLALDSGLDLDGGRDGGASSDGGDAGCPMMCGGECTDTENDPSHCGSCTRSCSPPDNATALCADGMCDFVCDTGFTRVIGACEPRAFPRPIAPLSTATVTSRRPTFRWELSSRIDGARVEICADRACASVLRTFDVTGTRGAPPSDLPTGVVFWRLFGLDGLEPGLEPSPTWEVFVGARTAPVDTSWGTTLDVNGDGYADVVVGAPNASSDTGRAYVYLGSASGLDDEPVVALTGPDGAAGRFGFSVASAGDVNGDGYADVVILGTGRAHVYLGGAGGLDPTRVVALAAPDGLGGNSGEVVASAGDVNGDGYADVVIGAPTVSSAIGRAYVYFGSASGLDEVPTITLTGPDGPGLFGSSVASAGDVNGDGYADLVVGAPGVSSGTGRVYVYLGSASGLDEAPALALTGPDGGNFGFSVASAGDVDGDGYADLIVGARNVSTGNGSAYVYFGGAAGLDAIPAVTLAGRDGDGGNFGGSVASAGDVNGDGYADLVVGAQGAISNTGRAYVYLGGAAGVDTTPAVTLTGPDGGLFGVSVASAGDVDGDGYPDVVVGAPSARRAYVYVGGASGLDDVPSITLTEPDGTSAGFGRSVASAGPLNRDDDVDLAARACGVSAGRAYV